MENVLLLRKLLQVEIILFLLQREVYYINRIKLLCYLKRDSRKKRMAIGVEVTVNGMGYLTRTVSGLKN